MEKLTPSSHAPFTHTLGAKDTLKIKVSPRESTAYIKLRKKGYSINHIAEVFGRSTSVVHRRLKRAKLYREGIRFFFVDLHFDKRKMPNHIRMVNVGKRHRLMEKFRRVWEQWILGVGEEPP